jgi:hypothetical protein
MIASRMVDKSSIAVQQLDYPFEQLGALRRVVSLGVELHGHLPQIQVKTERDMMKARMVIVVVHGVPQKLPSSPPLSSRRAADIGGAISNE